MRGWGGPRGSVVVATGVLSLALSGCSGDPPAVVEPATVTSTVTVTEEASTVTVTVTAEPTTAEPSPTAEETLLEKLKSANSTEPWLSKVLTVTQVSADQVDVETSIIDPRGDEGSLAAVEAIEVCGAVVEVLEAEGESRVKIFVYESDGSTFAYAGNSSNYECVEY